MTISILTNVPSLMAQQNLQRTNEAVNSAITRLSSGRRIVSSMDDPAGIAITEKLTAQINGVEQNKRNAEDGTSLLQVAEGGMMEVGNILIRMKELALQAANDTLSSNDRAFLNTELIQLKSEIDRISTSTKFNGLALLSGTYSVNGLTLQVGLTESSTDLMTIRIGNIGTNSLGSNVTISQVSISQSAGRARDMLKYIEKAINDISTARSQVGAQLSRLNSTIRNLVTTSLNLSQARSRVRDADVANETANLTKNQILVQAGVSVLSQANSFPQIALGLLS